MGTLEQRVLSHVKWNSFVCTITLRLGGKFHIRRFFRIFYSLLFLHVAKINITKKFIFVGMPEEQQKSLKIHVVVDFCVNVFHFRKPFKKCGGTLKFLCIFNK